MEREGRSGGSGRGSGDTAPPLAGARGTGKGEGEMGRERVGVMETEREGGGEGARAGAGEGTLRRPGMRRRRQRLQQCSRSSGLLHSPHSVEQPEH